MRDSTRLFGTKTKKDWIDLRVRLQEDFDNESAWRDVSNLLFLRLHTRFFRPIERILKMRITTGEGFAVMTLICSLIEFLESCYQGKNYRFGSQEKEFEYSNSGQMFKDFLLNHEPFKSEFSKQVENQTAKIKNFADDFYANVRCGLLHEATTSNGWTIKTYRKNSSEAKFVTIKSDEEKIVYREMFFEKIKDFVSSYLSKICDENTFHQNILRNNLCIKLDFLCGIRDNASWWNKN